MALTFRRLGIDLIGTGGTDIRVKVTLNDTSSGFLNDKIVGAPSGKISTSILNPNSSERLAIDVDETNIDHNILNNYSIDEHRVMDDSQTTTTTLWSSQKTQTELDSKVNRITPVADNRLLKSVGTTGLDMEQTGLTVDDSDNVTGINDLTIAGNLTVQGTTTEVDTQLLVTDANIEINKNGNQATANLNNAGITVDMSDATNAIIGYDSTLTSKFKAGEAGDLRELVTTTHTQTVTNKTINADNNTISNIDLTNLKSSAVDTDDTLSTADDTKLPTSETVKNYVDSKTYDSNAISYDNTISGLTATNVKTAVDELANEKLDTTGFSALFDTNLSSKDTDDLGEGSTNLYFTDTRARTASVLNTMTGSEIDRAPSVSAVKAYVSGSTPSGALAKSQGDLDETIFTATAGATNADVTSLAFNNLTQSAKVLASVVRDADSDSFEVFDMLLVNTGSDWEIAYSSLGNSTGISFDVTSSGQVTYTDSSVPTGHTSTTIKFRAITTTK